MRESLWPVLGVVSAGGVVGSLLRYGLQSAWPSPWVTFGINVGGCLLIGVLMVVVTEMRAAHRLVRPFLGVGVLGGFTTFSGYVADARLLLGEGAAGEALVYLVATMVAALVATWCGVRLARVVARRVTG